MTTIQKTFGLKAPTVFKLKPTIATTYPDLIMGTELEIEGCDEETDWGGMVGGIGFRIENDGSLRGRNNPNGNDGMVGLGLEFISKPMESDVLATAVHEFFNKTKFNSSNYSDRCSVHVHVNCQNLEWSEVACVALLYSVVEDCLFHFIGHERSNNIFCIPWSQCRISYDLVNRLTNENTSAPHSWQKYTALNLQPLEKYGTVEFRHMEGTHDPERIVQWFNIIGCLFRYCKGTNIADLMKEVLALNTCSDYRGFFDRVFQGQLQYNDEFEAFLENGVIQAKLQSINYGKEPKRKEVVEDALDLAAPVRRSSVVRTARTINWEEYAPEFNGITAGGGDAAEPQAAPQPMVDHPQPADPQYDANGWYNFQADSRTLGTRLGAYNDQHGTIETQRFVGMYATIQHVESRLAYIKDCGERLHPRGLGETNAAFKRRVDTAYNTIHRQRDERIRLYRQANPGDGSWASTIRTAEECDYIHYRAKYHIEERHTEIVNRRPEESIAAHCRRTSLRLGFRVPNPEPLA